MLDLVLYIVVPCYNEELVLRETSRRLKEKVEELKEKKLIDKAKILYVDDGSKDNTWRLIYDLHNEDSLFEGIMLSRNRGHQNALLAGLTEAVKYASIVISMDADLQDDINAIDAMIESYLKGNQVVYGVRKARNTDTFFKKFTAEGFYKVMNLLGAEIVFNHADYRLLSKQALRSLLSFNEVNLFLRGMIPLIGYKSDIVEYDRGERFAGESKYPLKKMLSFAADGITSCTIKPIRIISGIGILILVIGLLSYISLIFHYSTLRSIKALIEIMGGLNLTAIGIIGEYIGKTYMETKARPKFFINQKTYGEGKEREEE